MHDGSATTSITVFSTVKHRTLVSSGYVVGVQLGGDTNLRRRWQTFVRERQVFENRKAKRLPANSPTASLSEILVLEPEVITDGPAHLALVTI